MDAIQIFIFIVGIAVMTMVVGALYALVPAEISGPEEVGYGSSKDKEEKQS